MSALIFHEPATWNYTVIAGTSGADGTWTFTDSEGDPLDLSDFTEIRAQWRATYGSETPALTLTTADGSIVNGGVLGTLTVVHDTDETNALMEALGHQKRSYYHDWEGVHAGGIDPIFRGRVLLEPSAARQGDGS
jgi:hypothetical protein